MKKSSTIFLIAFLLIGITVQAQFNKPLKSTYSVVGTTEAKYNVGITGGLTTTHWFHFGGAGTKYNQPFNFGPTGGLVVERMLNKNSSVALEGLYTMRDTQLNYYVTNFPVAFNQPSKDYYRQLDVNYQEVNVQVPLTYYFGQANSKMRTYVYVAPRVTVPLSGTMIWQRTEVSGYGTEEQQLIESTRKTDTVGMSAQNTWQWSIGLVAGAGIMYKINVSNYYFIVKADVSAHAALAHFTFINEKPFIHASFINSFTYEEKHGDSQNVIGASYIDPYLLDYRINSDAAVKITIMFPLKKQLKGACMRWGEYD